MESTSPFISSWLHIHLFAFLNCFMRDGNKNKLETWKLKNGINNLDRPNVFQNGISTLSKMVLKTQFFVNFVVFPEVQFVYSFYFYTFFVFQSCWNCGRKANETCSGCNTARYCGAFCQHKDWENHHKTCGQYAAQATSTDSSINAAAAAAIAVSCASTASTIPTSAPALSSSMPVPSPAGSTHSNHSNASRTTTPIAAPPPPSSSQQPTTTSVTSATTTEASR